MNVSCNVTLPFSGINNYTKIWKNSALEKQSEKLGKTEKDKIVLKNFFSAVFIETCL